MLEHNIGFGFDSCSAPKFLASVKGTENYEKFEMLAESCESFSQSMYCNEKGIVVPCSFMENMQWDPLNSTGWNLLDDSIKNKDEFVEKIWNSNRAINFSCNASICASCGMGCQIYDV